MNRPALPNSSNSFPLEARPLPSGIEEGLQPSSGSCAQDYDFLWGAQTVWHQRLKHRLSGSNEWEAFGGEKNTRPLLGGISNLEEHHLTTPAGEVDAFALRLFDPATRLWSLYWADARGVLDPPLQGSFDGTLGVFFGRDECNGVPVWVQFQYDRSDPRFTVWGQAFSTDGRNWEWNWFMYFGR